MIIYLILFYRILFCFIRDKKEQSTVRGGLPFTSEVLGRSPFFLRGLCVCMCVWWGDGPGLGEGDGEGVREGLQQTPL